MQMMIPPVQYSIAASRILFRSLRSQVHTMQTHIDITVLLYGGASYYQQSTILTIKFSNVYHIPMLCWSYYQDHHISCVSVITELLRCVLILEHKNTYDYNQSPTVDNIWLLGAQARLLNISMKRLYYTTIHS